MFLDNFMTFLTFLLISPLLSRSFANAGSSVRIENGGYTNVVVAIAPHISEQEGTELIKKIQELFIEASVNLYNAIRQRAYFKAVNILVPQGWSNDGNYSESSFENFDDADIRVDDPNPTYGDGPYTLQSLPCGDPGHYIHLTPSYLRNLRENSTELFGPPGKTLVHEWAHLRYGIFDEFGYPGNEQYPVFYFKDKQMLVPNACANSKLFGTYKTATSGPCDYPNGYPDKNCIFVPNQNKIESNTSIASYHFLPKVSMFCDDTASHAHDPQAPNKHNTLCESRSTWSVISANSDFRTLPNNITDLVPTFKLVQKKRNTFCLSLDASTSMRTANRMILLKEAVTRLIMYDIPLGTELAITKFGKEGSTLKEMTTIKTDADREALNEAVQSNLNANENFTCLAQGLKSCVKILNDYRHTLGGVITIITDGDDTCNDAQKIDKYKEEFLKNQTRLISVTIGAAATENDLAELALESGGKAFFVPDSNDYLMESTFYDIFTQQATDTDVYIKIYEESFRNVNAQNIVGKFFIDSTLGRNVLTTVIFKCETNITDIENILIYGPSTNLNLNDGDKTLSHYIHFQFNSTQAGEYNYTLSRKTNSSTSFNVSVTTRSPNKIKPITARAWVHQKEINGSSSRYIIYAEVKQGNNPVINAKVVAKIDRPTGGPVFVNLFDKGNGDPDITRDDGIYSRYFTQFSSKGRYAVQAQITTDGSTAIIESGFTASSSMPVVNNYMGNLKPKTRAAETFQRLAFANEINLRQLIGSGAYPPSRITDLLVVNISTYDNSSKVTLQWTAPGGTLDEGKAQNYELYYSTNWNDLSPVFDSTSNASTFSLDISPSPSGMIEITSVNISGLVTGVTYYLTLVAFNGKGLFSKQSNIVSAQIIVPVEPEDDDQMIPIIVGIVLGVLFLLFVITSLTLYIRKKHRKDS